MLLAPKALWLLPGLPEDSDLGLGLQWSLAMLFSITDPGASCSHKAADPESCFCAQPLARASGECLFLSWSLLQFS